MCIRDRYKTLAEHLDKGEKRARRAHALYLGAKLELAKWEICLLYTSRCV